MKNGKQLKVLFIAMQNSVHTTGWIDLIESKPEEWESHLFTLNTNNLHPHFKNITIHYPYKTFNLFSAIRNIFRSPIAPKNRNVTMLYRNSFTLPLLISRIIDKIFSIRLGESEIRAPISCGPKALAKLIKEIRPDLIHSMETQHAGYLTLAAKDIIGESFPPWIHTIWGSDIFFYQQFPDHNRQLSRLLPKLDFFICECKRDLPLAKKLGLQAKTFDSFPIAGGFDLNNIKFSGEQSTTSKRKIILVKGFQHFVGRALIALEALESIADSLQNFKIVVFAPTPPVKKRINDLSNRKIMNIEYIDYCSHEKLLELHTQARIYLGVSLSDGISISVLEAMAMGAFPIQTETSCCNEWFIDGQSGFTIPVDNIKTISHKIKTAVTNDQLVDNAQKTNWEIVKNRLDQKKVSKDAQAIYAEIVRDLDL